MGAKYIPSIRDQKAAQRWRKRDNPNLPGFKKTPSVPRGAGKATVVKGGGAPVKEASRESAQVG